MYERSESGANSRRNLWFGVFYLCKATTERERNEFLTLWIVQSNLLSLIVLLFSIWSFGLFLFGFLYRSGCLHPFKSLFLWDDVIGAEVWQGAGLHYKQSLKLNLNLKADCNKQLEDYIDWKERKDIILREIWAKKI